MTPFTGWADDVRRWLDYQTRTKGRGGYPSAADRYAIQMVVDQHAALLAALQAWATDHAERGGLRVETAEAMRAAIALALPTPLTTKEPGL